MSSTINSANLEDPIYARLNKTVQRNEKSKKAQLPTPEELEKLEAEQIRQYETFNEVLSRNSTRKTNIQNVRVVGGGNSRSSFVHDQIQPLLDASGKDLETVIAAADASYKALSSFGIYERVNVGLDVAPRNIFSSSNLQDLDLIATVNLKQAKRFTAKTGTDIGNGEGSGYANFVLRSLFGGAEMLSFDTSIGTRTRASYLLNFNAPLLNSSVWRGEVLGFMSSRKIPWASHEQIIKGVSAKVKSANVEGGYEAVLRTITSVEPTASSLVKMMAGDSIKTSLFCNFTKDTRNNSLMPSAGYYIRAGSEIGGLLGPERGDSPFFKSTFEAQAAKGFSLSASPWDTEYSKIAQLVKAQKLRGAVLDDVIVQCSARGGLLYSYQGPSHFMDRFFLGGPNDVRGFQLNALGPHDEQDALGGDVFLAHGVSVLTRLPGLARENPLRFLVFANGGSVLGLDKANVRDTLLDAVLSPSVAAGFGLAYRHPVARFELNVTFPLVARECEGIRKGLQFGVGLSFL